MRRPKLTYANVMSTIAVMATLGAGTAYAAVRLAPANSVGANAIRTGAVGSSEVRNNSLAVGDLSLPARAAPRRQP